MDSFNADGVFWLPEEPDKQLAGRLEFTVETGASLSLMGIFGEWGAALTADDDVERHRIVGIAGRKLVTLDHCVRTATILETPGILRESYSVGLLLLGAQWDEGEALEFDSAMVSFDHLPNWVLKSGFKVTLDMQKDEHGDEQVVGISALYKPVEEQTVDVGDRKLSLGFNWSLDGDRISTVRINQQCFIKLEYQSLKSLEDLLVDVEAIRHLVTLTADEPAAITELQVSASHITDNMEPPRRQWVEVLRSQSVRRAEVAVSHFKMLYLYDQIGGLLTVDAWLRVAESRRAVLDALLSIRYSTTLYVENRYQNVLLAAETLHRLRGPNAVLSAEEFKAKRRSIVRAAPKEHRDWLARQLQYSNEPRLKDRLQDLATFAEQAFANLVGDTAKWAAVVAKLRNRLTHHEEDQEFELAGGDLFFLANSAYTLVLLCLLKECGISDDVLATAESNQRLMFLRQQLAEIVPRLHKQVQRSNQAGSEAIAEEIEAAQPSNGDGPYPK
jgi:hypothetical protein